MNPFWAVWVETPRCFREKYREPPLFSSGLPDFGRQPILRGALP